MTKTKHDLDTDHDYRDNDNDNDAAKALITRRGARLPLWRRSGRC
jgi:hypothetical protein